MYFLIKNSLEKKYVFKKIIGCLLCFLFMNCLHSDNSQNNNKNYMRIENGDSVSTGCGMMIKQDDSTHVIVVVWGTSQDFYHLGIGNIDVIKQSITLDTSNTSVSKIIGGDAVYWLGEPVNGMSNILTFSMINATKASGKIFIVYNSEGDYTPLDQNEELLIEFRMNIQPPNPLWDYVIDEKTDSIVGCEFY